MYTNDINNEIRQAELLASICLVKGYGEIPKIPYSKIIPEEINLLLNNIPELPPVEKGKSIGANIFLIKIPSYGLKINTPDWFIWLLDICSNSNPGIIQLMYKEILESINKLKFNGNGIPEGYTITPEDFSNCHPYEFPIIINPRINEKYSDLWDKQKISRDTSFSSDNKCDTVEYWMEVMKK